MLFFLKRREQFVDEQFDPNKDTTFHHGWMNFGHLQSSLFTKYLCFNIQIPRNRYETDHCLASGLMRGSSQSDLFGKFGSFPTPNPP